MDVSQTNHLKAYGITYWTLTKEVSVDWLLNYRGGSFLIPQSPLIQNECMIRNVSFEVISDAQVNQLFEEIASPSSNMDVMKLEQYPKIAVYSPKSKQPWDDAVTLALTYAEVDYETLWDSEVHLGKLSNYDWLHLHHEDFTGQYGKFYKNYHTASWYVEQKKQFESLASRLGFGSVPEQKKALAQIIKDYVSSGGFLFAMCSGTDSFDIALAAHDVDIADAVFDGTPVDPNYNNKINFSNGIAFENYSIITNPMIYEFSDIDYPSNKSPHLKTAEQDYFTLFEFSAKWDPVPTMLTQNHVGVINGFRGQTTGFNRNVLKKHVVILGEVENTPEVKYIHGNVGKGTFTFLGGHDPEDYTHKVGDPVTDLSLHPNSPGYRLILNNVLFPAARKKDKKT